MKSFFRFFILIFAVPFVFYPFKAFSQAQPLSPAVTAAPSSFSVLSGRDSALAITYTFSDLPVGAGALSSPKGSFFAGSELIGEDSTPLSVNIVNNKGAVSESATITAEVIDMALKKGFKRLSYKRDFFIGSNRVLSADVDIHITLAGLLIKGVDLYFKGRKKELTINEDSYHPKAYADIMFEGSGAFNGYWEVDGKILSRINKSFVHVKVLTVETPDLPSIPVSEPGIHRIRFVVTKPATSVKPLPLKYFVLPAEMSKREKNFVPGEIITVFKPADITQGYLDKLTKKYGLTILDDYTLSSIGLRVIVFKAVDKAAFLQTIREIEREGIALITQPNFIFKTLADPLRSRQYGNDILKIDMLHSTYRGRDIRVGIIDTGVDIWHKDLKDGVILFKNFVKGEDYKAEIHGTAVAGIIGARINGSGIEGVAPEADLFTFRACRQVSEDSPMGECFSDSLSKAINAAIVAKVQIVNMSLGGGEDKLLKLLIDRAIGQGMILIAPAGNTKSLRKPVFPSSYQGVISVGGLDEREKPYPNPEVTEKASVNAPAVNILTTFPNNKYNFLSGTSFSSAYISGILALAYEKNKGLNTSMIPPYSNLCKWEGELFDISMCE